MVVVLCSCVRFFIPECILSLYQGVSPVLYTYNLQQSDKYWGVNPEEKALDPGGVESVVSCCSHFQQTLEILQPIKFSLFESAPIFSSLHTVPDGDQVCPLHSLFYIHTLKRIVV